MFTKGNLNVSQIEKKYSMNKNDKNCFGVKNDKKCLK